MCQPDYQTSDKERMHVAWRTYISLLARRDDEGQSETERGIGMVSIRVQLFIPVTSDIGGVMMIMTI